MEKASVKWIGPGRSSSGPGGQPAKRKRLRTAPHPPGHWLFEALLDRVRDDEVEEAAMEAVMRYEARQGRHPRDVHVGNSWDVESDDEQGRVVRYIEVKGRGPEEADVVTMTGPEWEAARRLGDRHWLYIALLGDGMLVMIQNPFSKLKPRELKRWLVSVTEAKGHGEAITLDAD